MTHSNLCQLITTWRSLIWYPYIFEFRCSVLAAANSVYGRWDDTKGEENIDFLPTILSRFDMIYVVKDVHDPVRDQKLAQYVMNVHTGENETKEDKDELDLETLKK